MFEPRLSAGCKVFGDFFANIVFGGIGLFKHGRKTLHCCEENWNKIIDNIKFVTMMINQTSEEIHLIARKGPKEREHSKI